jgi:hypothetical protein
MYIPTAMSNIKIKKDMDNVLCEVKVKVKFALEESMKAQRGSRGLALLFL